MKRKYDFDERDKVKILLWCKRHCCLCGKSAGVGIEVAHIDEKSSKIDDAIPLCFDCHGAVGHYNNRHPMGRKYSHQELRSRRDQVYEEHTSHLVSPVMYRLTQFVQQIDGSRAPVALPTVRFDISNVGERYPVRARVTIILAQGRRSFGKVASPHYDGGYLWNLNPRQYASGHFKLPTEVLEKRKDCVRARVDVALTDIYEREHKLLTVGFIHTLGTDDEWYFEPSLEELGIAKGK